MEDVGGEIIDMSPLVAISLLWPAARQVQMGTDLDTDMGTYVGGFTFLNVTRYFGIFKTHTHTRTHTHICYIQQMAAQSA